MRSWFYVLFLLIPFSVCAAEVYGPIQPDKPLPEALDALHSQDDFELLAMPDVTDKEHPIRHVLYMIDQKTDQLYFINTRQFPLHWDFAAHRQMTRMQRKNFYDVYYSNDTRRFILGNVVFDPQEKAFWFETWDGDRITPALLQKTYRMLNAHMFKTLSFMPGSLYQETIVKRTQHITTRASRDRSAQSYQTLQQGVAQGVLRFIEDADQMENTAPNTIALFKHAPVDSPPVAGLIIANPTSPLSHVNMLAHNWHIPFAFIKKADSLLKDLNGKVVTFETTADGYTLKEWRICLADEKPIVRRDTYLVANLLDGDIRNLRDQRRMDANRYGAKSANLGELMHQQSPLIHVPPGFAVPFKVYADFITARHIDEQIAVLDGLTDPQAITHKLAAIRRMIVEQPLDPAIEETILATWQRDFDQHGVFVRSSTNLEDTNRFSAAGLFETVPNIKTADALIKAVKTVWASVWSDKAYAMIRQMHVAPQSVYPAVLIQQAMQPDSSGVMITRNPAKALDNEAVYINAKRGLGFKVVDGGKAPEELLYYYWSNATQRLNWSAEDSMLVLGQKQGVTSVSIEQRAPVLDENQVEKLAAAARVIRQALPPYHQDIEWLFVGKQLYIVQARPYR